MSAVSMRYGRGSDASGSLTVEEVELGDNISVSGDALGSASGSVAKGGLTPLGIVGINMDNATSSGSGASYVGIYDFYVDGTNATVSFRNRRSSAIKVKVAVYVLYQRN